MHAFTKDGLRSFHRWTHECLDVVLEHAAAVPFSLLIRPVLGPEVPGIRDLFVHILSTEAGWIGDLQNITVAITPPETFLTIEDIAAKKREVMAATMSYLDNLADEELNVELSVQPKGWAGPLRSPAFILHHVLTHAFHHKGQIVTMFRLLGYPVGDTDLQR